MYAIIKTGGKQLHVKINQEIFIEKMDVPVNEKVVFKQVLMVNGKVGSPLLTNAEVHGTVLKQHKEKKVIVFKYKPKKSQKSKYGHRQPYTKVLITDFLLDGAVIAHAEKSDGSQVVANQTIEATTVMVEDPTTNDVLEATTLIPDPEKKKKTKTTAVKETSEATSKSATKKKA